MALHAPQTFNQAELVGVFESGSQEWLQARKSGVGGSEIGAIMGFNPWESAYSLWAKKTNQIAEMDISKNPRVRFGTMFEEPILKMWAEDNPDWEVFSTGTYRHSETPHIMANPDALARNKETGEWIVIEVKTSAQYWDSVPAHYEAQVMQYLYVMGLKRAKLIGVIGWDWWESEIERNDFVIGAQIDFATKFWNNCQQMTKPDWDGSDATYKTIRQLNTEIEDTVFETEDAQALWDAQKHADEAYWGLNQLKSKILDQMGSAKQVVGVVNGNKIAVASRQVRAGTPTLVVRRK